jgi:hypothetical protein
MIPPRPVLALALSIEFSQIVICSEHPLPKNLGGEWIQTSETHTAAYHAPAWRRLLLSLRPWGEVGSANARMKLETRQVTLTGGFMDNERFSYRKVIPDAYGVGISGKITF